MPINKTNQLPNELSQSYKIHPVHQDNILHLTLNTQKPTNQTFLPIKPLPSMKLQLSENHERNLTFS